MRKRRIYSWTGNKVSRIKIISVSILKGPGCGGVPKHQMKTSYQMSHFSGQELNLLTGSFHPDEVDEIWVTFPDPHPGGRNANKRLTSPWFLNSYRLFLKNKGIIHLKTDNTELFKYTQKL